MKPSHDGQRRLGATDAAKLLGLSKYGGPADVYRRVVEGHEVKPNKQMLRGTREEPRVRALYVAETGAELLECVMPLVLEHPERSYMTCSPDAVTTDNVLVELKTASAWARGWELGPPLDYVLQCAHSMYVGDFARCHLYAARGTDSGDSFHVERCELYVLERDAELEAAIVGACERFWTRHVVPRVPPAEEADNAAPTAATEATP